MGQSVFALKTYLSIYLQRNIRKKKKNFVEKFKQEEKVFVIITSSPIERNSSLLSIDADYSGAKKRQKV